MRISDWSSDVCSSDLATTAARQPTCFSNRSPTTDLFAPGAFVTSTGYTGGTSTYGGSSQAAPMAAACAVALSQAAPVAIVAQGMGEMGMSTDPKSVAEGKSVSVCGAL